MMIWIDGQFVAEREAPKRRGIAPFETMAAHAGHVGLWDQHLARLQSTAAKLGLACEPVPTWRAGAAELLLDNGHPDGVLRLMLVPDGAGVRVVMSTRARSPLTALRCLPTVVARPADAPPGDIKAEPRAFYNAVLQQAQDGGADDGLVVEPDGSVLEFALGNLFVRRDGRWSTPPLDGRVLPGIARAILLERAADAGGRAIAELPCSLDDLHAAEALAHTNAVYGPRPVALVGGVPAVAIVDSELGALWRRATTG